MTIDPGIRLHRKQYVLGPRPHPMNDDWLQVRLSGGLWLTHCPDLRIQRAVDAEGREWQLLGLASQTRPDRADPVQDLAEATIGTVGSRYESWAGRWTLIDSSEVHLDATGQLPCHWVVDDGGLTWASSSPAVIRALAPGRAGRGHDLRYERGLSWVAPPLGSFVGARRLLPSQILNVESGGTRWRRLAVPGGELGLAPADTSRSAMIGFVEALGHGIARLPADGPKQIALTAGADSRLVLAAALASGATVDLFTRRSARMSVADRQIPPRLAAAVGLAHREVLPGTVDPNRLSLAVSHTDGHVSQGDAQPFVEAVRDGFSGVEIGGQGFGIGKVKNRTFPSTIGNAAETAGLIADHFGEALQSPNRQALCHWLQLVDSHEQSQEPEDRIDWRDRIYLEQRTSGWQAAKEQLYDLHEHHRFFPINSARVIGLLLAVDPKLRSDGSYREALIELADSRLLGEPFNPPGHWFGPLRRLHHLLTVDPWSTPRRAAKGLLRRSG